MPRLKKRKEKGLPNYHKDVRGQYMTCQQSASSTQYNNIRPPPPP